MRKAILKNKKTILKLGVSIIIIYSIVWSVYHFVIAKEISESAINVYLEEINVNKEEINYMEIRYDFKRGSIYNIDIKYKDELDLEYHYEYKINKGKFKPSSIYYKRGTLNITDGIYPKHETSEYINNIFNNEFGKIEMKYTFFDYIKDLIKN